MADLGKLVLILLIIIATLAYVVVSMLFSVNFIFTHMLHIVTHGVGGILKLQSFITSSRSLSRHPLFQQSLWMGKFGIWQST